MIEDNKKDKEVVEMTEKEKNDALANKGVKFGCLGFIVLVLIVYIENAFSEPVDACKCIEIMGFIDLDLNHDEKYWSKCMSEYGTSTVLYSECMSSKD